MIHDISYRLLAIAAVPFHKGQRYIHDIQDGEEYQNDPFFSVPEHTGLIMNTDGIPVFKSSKSSLWPILSVASLPPIRMNKDYILLAGVWFGHVKPQPALPSYYQPSWMNYATYIRLE